jgi:hypothetical protein
MSPILATLIMLVNVALNKKLLKNFKTGIEIINIF